VAERRHGARAEALKQRAHARIAEEVAGVGDSELLQLREPMALQEHAERPHVLCDVKTG